MIENKSITAKAFVLFLFGAVASGFFNEAGADAYLYLISIFALH